MRKIKIKRAGDDLRPFIILVARPEERIDRPMMMTADLLAAYNPSKDSYKILKDGMRGAIGDCTSGYFRELLGDYAEKALMT